MGSNGSVHKFPAVCQQVQALMLGYILNGKTIISGLLYTLFLLVPYILYQIDLYISLAASFG